MKKFDLNIEQILENWKPSNAIREFIANALDEQFLTNSRDIEIFKTGTVWHIRDYGRGIKYVHLTQNENQEKLNNPHVIGRFGIGLKDAIATLYRHGISISMKSKYGVITIEQSNKQGFDDIKTLHAIINAPTDINFVGTDISIVGIKGESIDIAKRLFLKFSGNTILCTTKYGDVIDNNGENSAIYINGVKIAEEENFLFSYNITYLNSQVKKALNRERTNVGRSAYSECVKKILLSCENEAVIKQLQDDFREFDSGNAHDEMKWIDIQEYILKFLNSQDKILFVDTKQILDNTSLIDEAKEAEHQIVVIPQSLSEKIQNKTDFGGNAINTISNFIKKRGENFSYNFVSYESLTTSEKQIFDETNNILQIADISIPDYEIRISENMQKSIDDFLPAAGRCDPSKKMIIIKRSQLSSYSSYLGTLIHEAVHAKTGYDDVSRDFELYLTETIGKICAFLIEKSKSHS